MPGQLKHDLFVAVCGQFGNDNATVRVSALNRANRMLSDAGLEWSSAMPGHGAWAETLAASDALPDPEKAETAATVNMAVVKGHGTWSAVLPNGTVNGRHHGSDDDFQALMEVEAFIRTYIHGLMGYGAWGREPGWREDERRPSPPTRQEPAPPEPLPVVVEGTVALTTEEPAVSGPVMFTVTREDGRVFGPFAALQPKVMERVASGTGTRMRVTTRAGTGRMVQREATRAVSA